MTPLRKILIGTGAVAALAGGSFVPVIPAQATLVYSYERPAEIVAQMKAASSTDTIYQAASVFVDHNGNTVEIPLTVSQYRDLGVRGGYAKNPTKSTLISFMDTLTHPQKAEAAIATAGNSNQTFSSGGASSVTLALTSEAPNGMVLGCAADPALGIMSGTYNGVAMTAITDVTVNAIKLTCLYLLNPAAGSNNMVLSRSVTTGSSIVANVVSYSGVKQSGQPDSMHTQTGGSGNLTDSTTVVAPNSWTFMYVIMSSGGLTAGTGSTGRGSAPLGGWQIFDSNGPLAPGSQSMSANGGGLSGDIIFSMAPTADMSATTRVNNATVRVNGATHVIH